MVIEGVHLVPGLSPARIDGALVVQAVLHLESAEVHRTRFHFRDSATGGVRPMDKYVSQLDEIRSIQSAIVEAADQAGVPVIESTNPERATAEVMELVLSLAEQLQPVR